MNISKNYSDLEICRVCLKESISFNFYENQNKSVLMKLRSFVSVDVSKKINFFAGT